MSNLRTFTPSPRSRARTARPNPHVDGCAGGDAHDTRRHGAVDHRREHGLAITLRHPDLGRRRPTPSVSNSDRCIARLRRAGSPPSVAARRTTHQRVGEIDRHIGDAFEPRTPRSQVWRPPAMSAFDRLRRDVAAWPAAPTRERRPRCRNRIPAVRACVPSTRSTFQPGRVSPSGCTTPLKPARVPSPLTNVPAVSVNGAIGSSTSAYAVPCGTGYITTTISACFERRERLRRHWRCRIRVRRAAARTPCAARSSIARAFMPPVVRHAPAPDARRPCWPLRSGSPASRR